MKQAMHDLFLSFVDVRGVGKIIAIINTLVALVLVGFYLRYIIFIDGLSITPSRSRIGELFSYGPGLFYLFITVLLAVGNIYCAFRLWKSHQNSIRRSILLSLAPLFVTVWLLTPFIFVIVSPSVPEFVLLLSMTIATAFILFVLWSQFKKLSVVLFLITMVITSYFFLSTLEENYCWRQADQAKDKDVMYYNLTETEKNFVGQGDESAVSGWLRTDLKCHESFNSVSAFTDSLRHVMLYRNQAPAPATNADATSTADRKTYVNEDIFELSLKYPSVYEVQEDFLDKNRPSVSFMENGIVLFTISGGKLKNYHTLPDCEVTRSSMYEPYKPPCLCQGVAPGPNNDWEEKKFENAEVFCVDEGKPESHSIEILQINSDPPLQLRLTQSFRSYDTDEVNDLYDQILSSFRFLGSPNADDASNIQRAIKLLESIPEIQFIQQVVAKQGRTAILEYQYESEHTVYIDLIETGFPDEHRTRIDTFIVTPATGEIQVEDLVTNAATSFDKWKSTVKERFE